MKWSKTAVRKAKINSKFINSPTVEYYRAKFKQSDLDMYFKCNDPKCERFGKRTPYDTILEMYSEYPSCGYPCWECHKKMIVTLERLPNEPRNIDIQMGYLGKDRYGNNLK